MASVLIVDDERPIRELLTRLLEPAGHTVRAAEDANVALALIGESPPDVVICDIHMPGANGLWLADRIRAVAPATGMVLLTGDSAVPPYESLRKGIVAYLLKPFQRDAVLRAVSDAAEWSAAEAKRTPARRLNPSDRD